MLTDRAIRNAQPKAKAYKLTDARSLFVYVTPAGAKIFRFKYRFEGRDRILVFGPYPDVTLKDARDRLTEAKALLRDGRDPATERRQKPTVETTFRYWADHWMRIQAPHISPGYHKRAAAYLASVYPELGERNLREIEPDQIFALIVRVQKERGEWAAKAVRENISAVFECAAGPLRLAGNPAHMIRKSVGRPVVRKLDAAKTLVHARAVLAAVEGYQRVHPITLLAHRLLVLTAVRSVQELRRAEWSEFDLEAKVWTIPGERMKVKVKPRPGDEPRDHRVPLTPAMIEVLQAAKVLGNDPRWVFPGIYRGGQGPIHATAFNKLLAAVELPVPHKPHGWRSSFSSIMNGEKQYRAEAIEAAMAHVIPGVRGVYARLDYLDERRPLMVAWGKLILAGAVDAFTLAKLPRPSAKIVPIRRAAA